jgi:hypothetical protein
MQCKQYIKETNAYPSRNGCTKSKFSIEDISGAVHDTNFLQCRRIIRLAFVLQYIELVF